MKLLPKIYSETAIFKLFAAKGAGRTIVGMIGKFAITASFTLVYIYTAELYATPVR